jgi:integrase
MASIYRRPDTQNFCLSCYPRPGAKLVRASLGTDNEEIAQKVARKVDLLIELEKMAGIEVPEKILDAFEQFKSLLAKVPTHGAESGQSAEAESKSGVTKVKCPIDDVIRSFLVRSMVANVHHGTSDKISRLRHFFGSERINALDPRPPEVLKRRKKVKIAPPWFKGDDLAQIKTETILLYMAEKKYSRSNNRHVRELFHELFSYALKSGAYCPDNPYAANPADDLPSFKGTGEPVTVLTSEQVENQYSVVSKDKVTLFGCQLMLEAGFRLHEILSLRRMDLDVGGKIRLLMPGDRKINATSLKTGQRSVTVRPALRPMIQSFLRMNPGGDSDWCFVSPKGERMTSAAFGESLRLLNRAAGLPWTSQDFRHTFATNRLNEGWNLKVLAQEMGTSVQMLMDHYLGYIDPPVLTSAKAIQDS